MSSAFGFIRPRTYRLQITVTVLAALVLIPAVGGCAGASSSPIAAPSAPPASAPATSTAALSLQTPVVTPPPEPTASPTLTPAPCPTNPGVLCVTFASFIADLQAGGSALDKYEPITVADLTTAYDAFSADLDIRDSGIGQDNPDAFKNCMNLKSDPVTRPSYCGDETVFAI